MCVCLLLLLWAIVCLCTKITFEFTLIYTSQDVFFFTVCKWFSLLRRTFLKFYCFCKRITFCHGNCFSPIFFFFLSYLIYEPCWWMCMDVCVSVCVCPIFLFCKYPSSVRFLRFKPIYFRIFFFNYTILIKPRSATYGGKRPVFILFFVYFISFCLFALFGNNKVISFRFFFLLRYI